MKMVWLECILPWIFHKISRNNTCANILLATNCSIRCCILFSFVTTIALYTGCTTSTISQKEDYDPQMMAYVYTLSGNYDSASDVLEETQRANPDDKNVLLNRVYCLIKGSYDEKAYKALQDYMNTHEPDYECYRMRGMILFNHKQFDEACADFDSGLGLIMHRIDPAINKEYLDSCRNTLDEYTHELKENYRFELKDAHMSVLLANYQNAYEKMERTEETYAINSACVDMLIRRAYIYLHYSEFDLAEKDYQLAVRLQPDNPNVYQGWSLLYSFQNDYATAITEYDRAIELDPCNPTLYINRAELHMKMNNYEHAYEDFTHALDYDPTESYCIIGQATVLYYLGNYEKSILLTKKYITSLKEKHVSENENKVLAYHLSGSAYLQLRQYSEAINDYDALLKINPTNLKAHYNRGIAYNGLKHPDAVPDLEYVVHQDPENSSALCELALAYMHQGKFDLAESFFKKAKRVNPECYRTQANLGYMYYLTKSQDSWILRCLDRATELNASYLPPYLYRAFHYRDKKQYDKSLAQLDAILDIDNTMYKAFFHKAVVYEFLQDRDNALDNYMKTIENAPSKKLLPVQIARKRITALKRMSSQTVLWQPNVDEALNETN